MAMRSPERIPHECSVRAVLETLRPKSRDVTGSHLPASRYSNMRSRLRSTAAKKMSFSVAMLIVFSGPESMPGMRNWLRTKLYCFVSSLSNAYSHSVDTSPFTACFGARYAGIAPVGGVHMIRKGSGVLAVALLLATIAASSAFAQTNKEESNMPKVGDMAPDFA